METSKKLTGDESNPLTSFAEAIHASLSAQQANDEAKKTQDTSGHGSEKPLASYDPDTQSWKMYGDTCLWGEPQCLEKLPPSGMTRNGVLYQQPAWVPITDAIESSSWPTPTSRDHKDGRKPRVRNGKVQTDTLGRAVQMWPTPTTQENEHPNAIYNNKGRRVSPGGSTHSRNLADTVQLTEQPQTGGKLNPTWVEWLMGFPTGWTDLEA
jgi:hypothetical protein